MTRHAQDPGDTFTLCRRDVVQILYLLDSLAYDGRGVLNDDDTRMAREMYDELVALVNEQDAEREKPRTSENNGWQAPPGCGILRLLREPTVIQSREQSAVRAYHVAP